MNSTEFCTMQHILTSRERSLSSGFRETSSFRCGVDFSSRTAELLVHNVDLYRSPSGKHLPNLPPLRANTSSPHLSSCWPPVGLAVIRLGAWGCRARMGWVCSVSADPELLDFLQFKSFPDCQFSKPRFQTQI